MDSRLSRWLDGLLEACWLAAILVTPLYFNIHSERVFEPDKIALLRSLTLVMGAAWCVKFVDQGMWRQLGLLRPSEPQSIWHKPFAIVTFTLASVYIISTVFSINLGVSWAGSYQRLQGTYTTLAYIVIFALMASTIQSRTQIRRVVTVAIIASIPVSFYGLLQHFGLDPLPWGGDVIERVAGHMGNAIFIAAYLIMIVPLTVARVIDAFSDMLAAEELSAADVTRASIYVFALAIQLLTIYWSGSRGPQIGLVVGLFAFMLILLVSLRDAQAFNDLTEQNRLRQLLPALLLLVPPFVALLLSQPISKATSPLVSFLFFAGTLVLSMLAIIIMIAAGRGWQWLWLGWILLTAFMALWLVGFNISRPETAERPAVPLVGGLAEAMNGWREIPTIGSYGHMLDASATTGREKSGRVRVLIWEGVLKLIAPHTPLLFPDGQSDPFNFLRPLLGYGPESMYVAYNRYYPAELATVEARNASPDRSHNETFDALVITGILGFLVWQALYLGVIYFALRYLQVIRNRRDSWIFIGLLVIGALAGALGVILLSESIYLGVAVPTGVVTGIILYLVYYALAGSSSEPQTGSSSRLWPFAVDRLLMTGLVAAVLAHYVEIHFGIAISVTRLYFFVYLALMVALAYGLPHLSALPDKTEAVAPSPKSRRKSKVLSTAAQVTTPRASGWNQLILVGLLLVLALGVMGYSFVTYSLPPGKIIAGSADLSAIEIFRQAFLQNARHDFANSPFVLVMMILTWGLGWLIALSEMSKHGELPFEIRDTQNLQIRSPRLAAGLFLLVGLALIVLRLLSPAVQDATTMLGRSLLTIWGLVNLFVGGLILAGRPRSLLIGGITAAVALAFSPVLVLAGSPLMALALAAISGVLLFVLWDPQWRRSLLPLCALAAGSLIAGFLYTFLHIERYRVSLFFKPPAGITDLAQLRGLEAASSTGLVTLFYGFVLLLVLLMAFAIAWPGLRERGQAALPWFNTPAAIVALALFMGLALYLTASTNMRPVQANMIFKRGRPFDDQASRSTTADPAATRAAWDAAISVYNQAIARAPREDYYYLFLGRALLERSGAASDTQDRLNYLQEAEGRLLEAQAINPLNTDHTANLARLYTRWYGVAADDAERQMRLQQSEQYYQEALVLSPQNSVVRNEYARLTLELGQDCANALALYDESADIDPYYTLTFLARADAYVACGANQPEPTRTEFYETAAGSLQKALQQQPTNLRGWIQLSDVQRQIGNFPDALEALEQARGLNDAGQFPTSELDFIEARIRAGQGETDAARALAEQALTTAQSDLAMQIEAFLADLDAGNK